MQHGTALCGAAAHVHRYIVLGGARASIRHRRPLVTGMGDLVAMLLLLGVATAHRWPALGIAMLAAVGASVPFAWGRVAVYRPAVEVLRTGWQPIAANLAISVLTGVLLNERVESLSGGLAVLVPVINGVGGNVASIYSSRMASRLHAGGGFLVRREPATLAAAVVPTHLTFLLLLRRAGAAPSLSFAAPTSSRPSCRLRDRRPASASRGASRRRST